MVNPYEIEKVADCIQNGLTMDKAEAEIRMVSLRNREQKNDLNYLLNTFLKEMGSYDIQGKRAFKQHFQFSNKYVACIISILGLDSLWKESDYCLLFSKYCCTLQSQNISDIFLCTLTDKTIFHLHNINKQNSFSFTYHSLPSWSFVFYVFFYSYTLLKVVFLIWFIANTRKVSMT